MKIVNRATFLALPPDTVYSKYKSVGIIDGLYQKGETWGNDWIYQDLLDEVDVESSAERVDLFQAAEGGKEFRMDFECTSRDGMFEDEQLFMVYDNYDLDKLACRLILLKKVVN